MKKYIPKINFIFFLLLPFIDLITSLTTRLIDLPVSLGVIIKSLYLIIITIYIFFYSNSKHRKKYIIYFLSVSIYSLLYFITKNDLITNNLFNEISSLFKVVYGSLIFFAILVLYDDYKYTENNITKLMFYSLITYVILLIVPTITKTNFNSYTNKNNEGSIGWFFAANDIGAILLMLYPYIYFILDKKIDIKNKKTYSWLLLLIPIIYSIFIIGTKTTWLGFILITFLLFIIYLIKRENKKTTLLLLIIIFISSVLTIISPTVTNINKEVNRIDNKNREIVNNNINTNKIKTKTIETVCTSKKITEIIKNKDIYKIIHLLFSGRENKAYTLSLIYKEASIKDKIFGIGFTNTKRINNCFVEKYIEIDIIDIFIHYGIFGFILILIPYIYLIKNIFKNKINLSTKNLIYILITCLMIIISTIAGHIIGYPSPNIYLSIYMLLIIINTKKMTKKV